MTNGAEGSAAEASWRGLPRPSFVKLSAGSWAPGAVTVVAGHVDVTREAERLRGELSHLNSRADGSGESATITLTLDAVMVNPEAWRIVVGDDVEVLASTATGIFRATRQLVSTLRATRELPRGVVESSPAVGERGLHLDAARAYFPASWIAELLHHMSTRGLNALQWHFSDNEGFRIASDVDPSRASADHISLEEARELIALAADLHITIVPSLDMPGHLRHVLRDHADLRLDPSTSDLPTDHALDITGRQAREFALDLVSEYAGLFADSTAWNLDGDEFVDFARMDEYPTLAAAARERFGEAATGFDLLPDFVNEVAGHLRSLGFTPRAWNDGLFRSAHVALDAEVEITWWTNWHGEMRPLAEALELGHTVVNFHDSLLYFVLGEHAGYTYPTAEALWAADRHPGLFSPERSGDRQELVAPYPPQLRGAYFSIWSDLPEALTSAEIAERIALPLAAFAERSWNCGSALSISDFHRFAAHA